MIHEVIVWYDICEELIASLLSVGVGVSCLQHNNEHVSTLLKYCVHQCTNEKLP